MKATDIRKGHVLMIDGQPCRVMDFTHRTPGNLRAFVQVRFRNLVSGNTFDQRLAATDFLNEARLDTKEMQVLYQDQGGVHVMDQQTYEQFTLDERAVGEDTPWLQPEMVVQVEWLEGRPIAIELPGVIELKVVETSPVMKTATKTARCRRDIDRDEDREHQAGETVERCDGSGTGVHQPRREGARRPAVRSVLGAGEVSSA